MQTIASSANMVARKGGTPFDVGFAKRGRGTQTALGFGGRVL
jgi:hypothetical protein